MDKAFKYAISNKITTEAEYPYAARKNECDESRLVNADL